MTTTTAPVTMIEKTLNGELYTDANGKRYPAVMLGDRLYDFADIEKFEQWLSETDEDLYCEMQVIDENDGFSAYTAALIAHRDVVMTKIGYRRQYWSAGDVDIIRERKQPLY